MMTMTASIVDELTARFGQQVRHGVALAPYTSARIGGLADVLVTATSADELAALIQMLWQAEVPYLLLGGGSNVLVSDAGVRGVTVLNRAKALHFESGSQPTVQAESGTILSNLANRCGIRGVSGLEWAATVPGTIGGAVYGNAGAFGGDMAHSLVHAELLTPDGREQWPVEKLAYGYRTSILKRGAARAVVLSAEMALRTATKEAVAVKIGEFSERRKTTQPPGASMGSMFKNPEGDAAGRLIEAAGLKGTRIGSAEVSPVHGNFFINHGKSKASDVRALIVLVQDRVQEKFGVRLELEVELVGDWNDQTLPR
ncbi:MAG TPA: UDP-N-acetylmuramate dehydrogenase [Anaerolineales bacterium]